MQTAPFDRYCGRAETHRRWAEKSFASLLRLLWTAVLNFTENNI